MYENGHPVVRNIPAKEDVINILHNHKTPSFPASRLSQNTLKTSPHTHNSRIITGMIHSCLIISWYSNS